jgi:hypothetical protein
MTARDSGRPAQARPGRRPGRAAAADSDVAFLAPPAPSPETVAAARQHLTEQYAEGVERLLWDMDKRPMPDQEAVQRVIAAAGNAGTLDITAALVLAQAARLELDRAEHDIFQAAHAGGITHEAIAAVLDLPGAAAADARQRWLAGRRALPYEEPGPLRPGVPDGPAEAAARAGRRARQAAHRAAQLSHRLDQLNPASGQPRPPGQEDTERSAAHAGEARILVGEALERAILGLLRAAEAQERCAASYERLASADHVHRDELQHEATRHWQSAQEYRQLAREYRPDDTHRR